MEGKNIQLRYQGYLNTPLLWEGNSIEDLEQLELSSNSQNDFSNNTVKEIRLGKLIEHFVFHELSQNKSIEILASNIQLIDNKLTIGEIDCLLKFLNNYIHLEIIYKFYLYDQNIKTSEIDKWIGPNRKDSLSKKIAKLKTKQLPILKHKKTREILNKLELDVDLFQQKVYFKAQLFAPFKLLNKTFDIVNNRCINGYYLSFNEVKKLTTNLFYIPIKLDWLIVPHKEVKWLSYKDFLALISFELEQLKSPLCWIKNNEGKMQKIFVVYWL
jgi:hypothetical protein